MNVNKKLLVEKSTLEKKQARQKCMENRLRLGQFVTQRQGATFVENWVDGSAFNDIMKQQEIMNHAKEELDKERKLLQKKRPQLDKNNSSSSDSSGVGSGSGSSKSKESKQNALKSSNNSGQTSSLLTPNSTQISGNNSQTSSSNNNNQGAQIATTSTSASVAAAIAANTAAVAAAANNTGQLLSSSGNNSNSNNTTPVTETDGVFTKPYSHQMSIHEWYEQDEILRLRQASLKKEEIELQSELEKMERERNLHIREIKRIHNEDHSRFKDHPTLNERYLLLNLIGNFKLFSIYE